MRFWRPTGLSARIIALTLLALLVSQGVSYLSFIYNQDHLIQRIITNYMSQSVPSIGRMLGHVRPGQERAAVRALSNTFAAYDLTNQPLACPPGSQPQSVYEKELAAKLHVKTQAARVCTGQGLMPEHPHKPAIALSVKRADGRWLEVRSGRPGFDRGWFSRTFRNLLITALIMILAVVLVSRRITRPLRELANAAERFGRGESVAPLAERGGDEIKRSIVEFNRMRERLERFVAERTRLVAALAHDLRTPITALRLRLEFLPNDDNTRAMNATLEDMADMSEAALTFMREEAATEATRYVDLAALIDALCEDYRAAGRDVLFEPEARLTLVCRPVAIRRALRNIIDNALAYGERATLRLTNTDDAAIIDIEDEGPGIDAAQMETVFDAFVRLEASRSRETGGAGLGLAIARSAVRGHGGDIRLGNRPAGGLRVRIRLPRART